MKEVRNILIGLELREELTQLSYYDRKAREAVSMPLKVGTNIYTFPTKLVKLRGKEEWHYGMEAEHFSREGGISLTNPIRLALENRSETVEGKRMEAWEVLAVYVREVLKLFGLPDIAGSAAGICVTSQKMTANLAMNLKKALSYLGFDEKKVLLEDERESFYYYCYSQKMSVWANSMAFVRFSGKEAEFYSMSENRSQNPHTVRVQFVDRTTLPDDTAEKDIFLAEFLRKCIGHERYSSIFLIGDGFDQEWAKISTRVLIENSGHVYEGENLFVRGAVYTALEMLEKSVMTGRMYVGPDLVETNVTMDLIDKGTQKTYKLIHAGRNWFDNSTELEFILDGRDDVTVTVSPMNSVKRHQLHLPLEGLPKRPNRTTRIRLTLTCTSPQECEICAEDLGFGELFPATHKIWKDTLSLGEGGYT